MAHCFASLIVCIIFADFLLTCSLAQEDGDNRPYLQVLPDGNLVIASALNRNLTLKTPGSGVVTINGVNLASYFDSSGGVACNNSICANGGTCVPSKVGTICVCPPNWKGRYCRDDVDECRQSFFATCLNGGTCINNQGGFSCQCPPEYSGKYCETPFNDCTPSTCGNGACIDVARTVRGQPAYRCLCNTGWRQAPDRAPFGSCNVDIDECAEGTHACSRQPRVSCINLPGSYSCGSCPPGYTAAGRDCIDVDECATQRPCSRSPPVSCVNVPGSYICGSCPPDFEGDGRRCQPVNKCRSGSSFCHPLATCVAIQNSVLPQCNCPPGYTGGGYGPSGCFPMPGINGSVLCSNLTCFNGGTCQSPPGSAYFTCTCPVGFSGRRCEVNIDDCASVRCSNGGTCQDVINGFRCLCPARFTGRMCEAELEGCGGMLTNSTGILNYPRFQTAYNNSMDCEWLITPFSLSTILRIEFVRMDLENDVPDCNYDFVEVRDGPTSAYPLLFPRLCGRTVPSARNSSRNSVVVRFHSDASHAAQGFQLRWTTVLPVCGGVLTAPLGAITSPGFPGPYPPRRNCVWRITLIPGSVIQFTFGSMDIESSANCSADSLKIFDGSPPFSSTLLGTFCGRAVTLTPLRSIRSTATVIFTSDSNDDARNNGFSLQYTSSRNCGEDFSAPSGVISFPPSAAGGQFNRLYAANTLCHWSIVLPTDRLIAYAFEKFDLEYTQGCTSDYVELRSNFDPDTSQLLGIYCGRPVNASTISGQTPGNTLLIKFRSDSNPATLGTGFRLRYSTACGGVFTDHIGRISTPNYPNNYPNNSVCSYLISTGSSQRIALRFTALDLQERDDCVDIFDGTSSAESPLIRHLCGRYSPFEINSTASSLLVRFTSLIGGRRGFRAFYESIGFDCGGVLTDFQGTITSPGFPGRYPHGVICFWAVSAPAGHVIQLTFSAFTLEQHPNCDYDFVYIYEDPTPGFNGTLGKFCGTSRPPVLTSFSNVINIKFSSDASFADIGFSASYAVLPAQAACGGEIRQSYGLIRSPNYPNRYGNGILCEWTIIGRPGSQVKLNITDFDLEGPAGNGSCSYDYLEIRQGTFASSPLVAKLCGSGLQQRVFVGFSNRMYVRFVTDSHIAGRGFRLVFDTITTGCGGTLSSLTGTILSPNFPLPYDHMADCYWTIRIASGNRIRVNMPIIDLEDHAFCNYDYVEMRESGPAGSLLGRFCNQSATPPQLFVNSSRLWVRFRSDAGVSGSGFMINYRTVCQGIELNALHATIQSPGYPDSYPDGLNCSWTISAPVGNRINITFADFDIDLTRNCTKDYLAIYDIGKDAKTPLGKLCGYAIPATITSRTNKVLIEFVTNDDRKSGDGFSLDYLVFGCGEIFTHDIGYLEYDTPEPVYVDGSDPNVECQWSIRAPVGRRILLSINEMSIGELTEGRCEHASLQIFNSPSFDGKPASTLCGHIASDRNFTSTGNFMTLHLNPIETFPNERNRIRAWYRFIDGGCGGSFSVPSGTISSPIQPGTTFYPPNVFCQWFIHAQTMHAVNFTFLTFQLEDSPRTSRCAYDYVDVYDGFDSTNNRTRLLRHCGLTMPDRRALISSHGNDMLVEMKADGTEQYSGFTAEYSESCGAAVNLTTTRPSVDFNTPNHPRPYHLGANCTWIFNAVNGGRILLEFTRFDLPNSTNTGCLTYLRLFDGDRADSIELRNSPVCGTALPQSFFTRSSMLVARFFSSTNLIPRTGFLATATLLDQSTVCGKAIEADHGVISSPMYPDPYPANFECIWLIKASPGNKIGVQFSEFGLQSSDACIRDFVELREGGPGGRLLKNRLCGQSVLPAGIQFANPVWLKFSSDATIQNRGFMLRFYTVYGGDYSSDTGQIASPNYPRPYGPNMDVRWTITIRQNYIIELSFLAFDLENSNSGSLSDCLGDFLEIRDGSSQNSPLIGSRMCGRRAVPRTVYSTGNRLHLYLHTDWSIEAFGFLANWTAVLWRPTPSISETQCSFDINVNDSIATTISNPVNSSRNCVWRLKASPIGHLRLNVTRLNIPIYSRSCHDSFVAFYETINGRVVETRRLCGVQRPLTPIASVTNQVTIVYQGPSSSYIPIMQVGQIGFTVSAIEDCGSMITSSSGNLTSPRYPFASPFNTSCVWTIMTKPGRTISAQFSPRFGINDSPPTCRSNYVEVTTTSRSRFCGSTAPWAALTSPSNYLTVNFVSGATGALAPGFFLTFKEQPFPCGDTILLSLDNPSATVISPRYPQTYLPHLDCRWLITAPAGESITINFESIDLEGGFLNRCPNDVVELRDGSTTHAPLLASICGSNSVSTLHTSDNTLLIRFITDESSERTGFSVKLDIASCGGTIYGNSGSFSSPRYPGNYPASTECVWTVHAPAGHFVAITFDTFELSRPLSIFSCTPGDDLVQIYDGKTIRDPLVRALCGNLGAQTPVTVNTSDSWALIRFRTNNDQSSGPGFSATFKASIEECGGNFNATSGTIQSPNWPGLYPHLRTCRWNIRVPDGRRIRLRFTNFSLETGHHALSCIYDYVAVFNGIHENGPLIGRYCGSRAPEQSVRSSMNTMSVVFRTDGAISSGGFRAIFDSYEQAECGRTVALVPALPDTPINRGTIMSPNNSSGTFGRSIWCVWKFVVPAGSSGTLLLQFANRQPCILDAIEIHEGITLDSDALSLGSFCNGNQSQSLPLEVPTALGPNAVWVVFTTNSSVSGTGFNLTYQFFGCGGRLTLPPNNWIGIRNLNYPNLDQTRQVCAWLGEGSPDSRAQFRVDDLAIDCSVGKVTIYNGPSLRSPSVVRLCNNGSASSTPALNTVVPLQTQRVRIVYQLRQRGAATIRGRFRIALKAPVGGCGGVIHAISGNLSTPNYPLRYPSGTSCTWVLSIPTGYHFMLSFSPLFDIPQTTPTCSENFMKVIEFPSSSVSDQQLIPAALRNPALLPSQNVILPAKCGSTSAPRPFNSSENGIAVSFFGTVSAAGFELVWTVGCGETFTDDFGVISSPNYPNNYENNLQCDYVIAPVSADQQRSGRFIVLEFLAFNLEPGTSCQFDSVTVSGWGTSARFCGSTLPRTLTIASNTATVRFVTDEAVTDKGFQIRYRATECGGILTASPSGFFGTPTTPQDYPHGADCTWTLRAPPGRVIMVTFTQFGIEAHPRCSFDYVEVFDGANDTNTRFLGRYCGRQAPPSLSSSGQALFIRFHSDHTMSDIGFRATYQHTYACGGQVNVSATGNGGSITSLDANGDGFYEANLDCVWLLRLQPPTASRILSITFDTFQLEPPLANSTGCLPSGDYVQIFDGAFLTSANSVIRYCGTSLAQKTFTSTGANMAIVFHSNAVSNFRGFTIRYSAVIPLCGGRLNATSFPAQLTWTPPATSTSQSFVRCLWQIYGLTSSERINVTLVQMKIPASLQCRQSYLEFKDKELRPGITEQPAHYCGPSVPLPLLFESTTDVVTITYVGELPTISNTSPVFRLFYQSFGCNRRYSTSSGRLTSPGYPGRYPRNSDCQTFVNSPSGTLLAFYFNYLDIEIHASCDFDYLQIRNGTDNTAPVIARFCNNASLPNPIFLNSNMAYLHFHTDSSMEGGGYDITYTATPQIAGCGGNFTHVNGTFTSPRYPLVYPPNLVCTWRIQLPSRYQIQVIFPRFFLLPNSTCATDNLSIYGGLVQAQGTLRSTLCRTANVAPLTIFSNSAIFVFRSGNLSSTIDKTTVAGFRLTYNGILV